ncbi:MAG: Hsp20/alpha crystallin family protein [Verrucomicrobiia bacterium]
MKSLINWDPFRELEGFQNRLSSFFGRTPLQLSLSEGDDDTRAISQWMPLVDISEDEKEYIITAELPEIKKENVKVTVENGSLCITGERSFEKKEKNKRYHRIERFYGNFIRSFALPEDAEASKIVADFKEGVLKVHLPKSEKAKPQEIEVKVQ